MEVIKLKQSGRSRRTWFRGTRVFQGSTKDHDSATWDIVQIIDTEDEYVVGIAKKTNWHNEEDVFEILTTKRKDEIIDILEREVPDMDLSELKEKILPLPEIKHEKE